LKVKIKNFQSIESADLTVDGFTVIVGRSNIGKSAIVRAIDGALTNLSGDSFVRLGEHHAEVELETDNLTLKWSKGGGLNDYVINGEDFESVGRGAPSVIAEAGFREVEVSRATIPVQVAGQFNPIFLLDPGKVSGSLAAEVVSDIGRLGELQSALRNAAKDRRSLDTVQRVRRKDLKQAKSDVEAFENLDASVALGERLRELHGELDSLSAGIRKLEVFQEAIEEAQAEVMSYEGAELLPLPSWDSDALYDRTKQLETFQTVYKDALTDVRHYQGLGPALLPDWTGDGDLKRLEALTKFKTHAESAQAQLNDLGVLPDVPVTPEFDLEDLHRLEEMRGDFAQVSSELPKLDADLKRLEVESRAAHDEVHALLEEAGICPLCNTDMS